MFSKRFLISLLFISISIPLHSQEIVSQKAITDHVITVFIHGTAIARRILYRLPCRPHIYCPQGLTLAKNLPEHYHFHKIAKGSAQLDASSYSLDRFYIFGWRSESVNNATRLKAASDLITALEKVVKDYYVNFKVIPQVRLIGFSHGGNVVLNTVNYLPLVVDEHQIDIEAWLIATPIQRVNHDYINHKKFTKIYSIYSKKDWLQRIDPQGIANKKIRKTHFWSDRTFDEGAPCLQVKFTVNSKSISHTSYRPLFQHFPSIQNLIESAASGLDSGMIEVDFKI